MNISEALKQLKKQREEIAALREERDILKELAQNKNHKRKSIFGG